MGPNELTKLVQKLDLEETTSRGLELAITCSVYGNVENWDNSLHTQQARFARLLRTLSEKSHFGNLKCQMPSYRDCVKKIGLT